MKNTIFLLCIVCICCMGMSTAGAADFKIYPQAVLDQKLSRESTQMAAQANPGTKASIYVTDESFEKVLSFYKSIGKAYTMPYQQPGKYRKLPSGKELKVGYVIFDGAKDLLSSRLWVKIQRPFINTNMTEGPDKTYINLVEKQ